MHIFYVDVPYDYNYDFTGMPKNSYGYHVLSRDFGVQIEFICNDAGGISEGDAHSVEVESEKDELFFLLKSSFKKLNNSVVEKYISKRRRCYETNNGSPRR